MKTACFSVLSPKWFCFLPVLALVAGCGGGSSNGVGTAPAQPTVVATPVFTPAAGSFTSAQSVSLSDSTSGASIYYTIDGSTPTTASTVYTVAIAVSATTTIKALATATGDTNSAVASATYTINLPAATPTFSPAGGTYTAAQSVSIADATPGATIYYTTNGSVPTTASTVYSAPISVSTTTTINAIAATTGGTSSAVATATFTINLPAAATPTFTPVAGTYTSAQTVSILDSTSGAAIYYTTDGSTPTTSSTKYSAAIAVSATTTIKAIAAATNYTNSAVSSGTFTINLPAAATPTFSPVAGTYTSAQTVSILDSTSGAAIYYTTDGSTPTTSSTKYSAAIAVSATTTIKAIAAATNYTDSAVASGTFTITLPTASTPTFSPVAGTYSSAQGVSIMDSTSGATIYYTTDGSTPTTSSTKYTTAIAVSTTTTIKALAVATNYTDSAVGSATFTINIPVVATPTFSPVAGTYSNTQSVTLSDGTSGAAIYYTTDGVTTPSASSTMYTAPISVTSTTTIKAIGILSGDTNSAVASATFTISSTVATPTISPDGGSFTTAQTVTLADTNSGAAIYYTLDGSTPTASSTLYAAPFAVNAPGSTTVSAIAIVSGFPNSAVTTATFTLKYPVTFQPTYSYKPVQIIAGGYVDGLYFHPKQQGLMYAHTDIGGAYRFNNVAGGDTQWVPLNDFIGGFNSGFDLAVQSLAIDPNDSTRLYLAIGAYTESYGDDGAVLTSTDMGNTFTAVPMPFKMGGNDNGRNDGDRLVVDPNNSKHLYLGTFINGLYESNNQAASWGQVTKFPITGVTSNPEDPEAGVIFEDFIASSGTVSSGNTKTVYYGVSSPTTGVYVSNDGGSTFASVPGQPTGYYPNASWFDSVNNILYVTYALSANCPVTSGCDNAGPENQYGPNAGQVWAYTLPTSNNASGTWTNITPPQAIPSGGAYGWNSVVVDPNNSNIVMVTTLNKYYPAPYDDIFRSIDRGKTWVNIGTNIVRDPSLSPWVTFGDVNANGTPMTSPGNWLNHLVIDPFNSNHVLYGNGQTVWETMDMSDADGVTTNTATTEPANTTNWAIGALGIEETDVITLVSPTSGPAHLFSGVGDIGGFTHLDLTKSPTAGAQKPSRFSNGTSTDFAANSPLIVARVGSAGGDPTDPAGSKHGSYSTDGGQTWTEFAKEPTGTTNGSGTIAVSADGTTMVWLPSDQSVAAAYTTNNGATWTASTGGPVQTQYGQILVASDRVNAKKFYLFDSSDNNGYTPLYVSTDGGHTYTEATANPQRYNRGFAVSPNAEGDVWFYGYNGMSHTTNSGASITQISGIDNGSTLGFGAAEPGYTYPAIYFVGHVTADTTCAPSTTSPFTVQTECVYRSVDGGTTFVLVNDFAHQYGSLNTLTGDPRVFGRIYLGTPGRGIIEADSPN